MGDMIASQYCRAWQSADLAFGHDRKDAALNFEKSGDDTPEPITAMRERVLPNLATPIAAGTNLVVVGNGDPFETVTGIYPEPKSVAFALRQTDTGVGVQGSIATDARPAP